MGYEVKLLADSISIVGHRLTTFEVTFPRIVLAEVNTHKMLSKNSASSRATPVEKRIAMLQTDPFIPEAFGRNKSGMQHDEVLDGDDDGKARFEWMDACKNMIFAASNLAKIGVHKQLANRLLEPFSWHTAILSGTDWDNFEHLRVHPAAQGEFSKAARMMMDMKRESSPVAVESGEWHLPHVPELDGEVVSRSEMRKNRPETFWLDWAKVSAARCGRVSFMRQDARDFDKDVTRANAFITDGHLSPLEHPARPMTPWELDASLQYEVLLSTPEGNRHLRVSSRSLEQIERGEIRGIALLSEPRAVHYCGNFNGWVQLRKLVPGEYDALGYNASKGGS